VSLLPLNAGDVADATRGRLVAGDAATPIGRITIDSRALAPGDFFIAIRGERFDGHAFAAAALEHGAIGTLIADAASVPAHTSAVVVIVEDTTRALQEIARWVRRRSGTKVVAITGSAGKTTTKEICGELLSARYRVFRNRGNLNNHIGLPLSLLELRTEPDVAVVELGMNHPGEIQTLVRIAEPEVRVWTNVGDAHIGFFDSAETIADAKAEITTAARADDVLVVNGDDPRIMSRTGGFPGRIITFGIETDADVHASGVELRGLDGTRATVRTPAGSFHLSSPLLGLGNLSNVLAATAVAIALDVPVDAIAQRTAALKPAHHRGELLRLPGGVTLIDDSYNSSPAALKQSLQMLGAASGSARKVAVLGEMLELGVHATPLHQECGQAAAAAGLDVLITVGGDHARELAAAAVGAGMPAACVIHVAAKGEGIEAARQRVRPGDLVLVKGSRGIGLDAVVERLKAEFA
jgi:UDP-N-acetylmuramoyl-tripeptide--D-alanyl-D-alanine ligase